ncbi:hypothetical protein ACFFH4_16460 [Halalkalibacter alkalisediminis]|uniref:Rod shape-determining protein MreD n=1 Tax=Halalkalibacter alkalisediminis TaxID=935616 RepID=A0ABV6NIJ3_9BACI
MIIFGIAFLISQVIILNILKNLSFRDVFILQTTFDPLTFSYIVNKWISRGLIDEYFLHYYFDFIHPFFYASFLGAIISKALMKGIVSAKYSFIVYLPFLAGLFDIFENILHLYMIHKNIFTTEIVVTSAIFTNLKWLLSFFCLLVSLLFMKKRKQLKS